LKYKSIPNILYNKQLSSNARDECTIFIDVLKSLSRILVSIENIDKRINRGSLRYLTTCIEETLKSTRHVQSDFQLRLNSIQPSARFERVITLRSWNCVNDRALVVLVSRWAGGRKTVE